MRKLVIALFVILSVNFCLGTTVYLRKGGTIEGEVISKDDEKFVLKTAEGEKTIKWRSVKNKSIKEIYPELYEALKAQAIERKKKKEETNKGKNNIEKKERNFSKIRLNVKITEKGGTFKKQDSNRSSKMYQKESYGIISISLSGLDPKKKYTIKTVYSHYFKKIAKKQGIPFKNELNIVKEKEITGKERCEFDIESAKYLAFRQKLKQGWTFSDGGGKRQTWGSKPTGWDVSVSLNGTLVYEKKKGKDPIYYKNISH